MFASMGRDVVVSDLVQEVQRLSGLDEAICRRAVIAAVDRSSLPLTQAGEQLVNGLREQQTSGGIVALFWEEVHRLHPEQEMSPGQVPYV